MQAIELDTTSIDDWRFIDLVASFVSHYATLYSSGMVRVIHVDNWFGERWLGFAGKILGAAGVRNRKINDVTLPSPPFRPSRIKTALTYYREAHGRYTKAESTLAGLHAEKSGAKFWHLFRPGLYCWYSGNTLANTTGSLMIYDVTRDGSSGWYVLFDRNTDWQVTRTTNVAREECTGIVERSRGAEGTAPDDAGESPSRVH